MRGSSGNRRTNSSSIEGARAFNDPDELARLRGAVVQGFKEFEFTLRRQVVGAVQVHQQDRDARKRLVFLVIGLFLLRQFRLDRHDRHVKSVKGVEDDHQVLRRQSDRVVPAAVLIHPFLQRRFVG